MLYACVCDCVILRFLLDATLNLQYWLKKILLDAKILSSPYKSTFSSKLMLEIPPHVKNTKHEEITSVLQRVYDLKLYGRNDGVGGGWG